MACDCGFYCRCSEKRIKKELFTDGFRAGLEAAANYSKTHILFQYRSVEIYDNRTGRLVDTYIPDELLTGLLLASNILRIELPNDSED